MNIKPIKTTEDHKCALAEIDRLFCAEPGTPEEDQLEVWVTLVEAYEEKHFPIPPPDPIEAIKYHMESRGMDVLTLLAFEVVNGLGEARQEWVSTVIALVDAKRDLALANAFARDNATMRAGGAKALGSNADLRELALIVALSNDLNYQKALAHYDEAFEREARAKQAMLTLNDTRGLFEVVLG